MQAQYLRNWRTGVILPYSDLLAKQPHLVPCDKAGNPLYVVDAGTAEQEVREKVKQPFLVNAKTGVVLPWSDLLAKQAHLYPCPSIEEGQQIYRRLKERKAPKQENVNEWAPPPPEQFYKTAHGTASSESVPEKLVARDPQYERGGFSGEQFSLPEREETASEPLPPPPEPEQDVDSMDREQLLALADEKGERIDRRLSETNIREQVRVLLMQGD